MAESQSRGSTAGPKRVEVKLLKTHVHGRETFAPGAKITVREDQAERLRKKGVAE